jgi:hypothetical protein
MSRLEAAARGIWEFVVGDDWRVALVAILAIAVTALVSDTSVSAWWILPLAVVAVLTASVWTALRDRG